MRVIENRSLSQQDFENLRTGFITDCCTTAHETVTVLMPIALANIHHLASSVSDFASEFDSIIIGGKSRRISGSLLVASGISPKKLIYLNHLENTELYQVFSTGSGIIDRSKIEQARRLLTEHGVFNRSKTPKICVVDEFIVQGSKAKSYLSVLKEIVGLTNCAFAAFIVLPDAKDEVYLNVHSVGPKAKLYIPDNDQLDEETINNLYLFFSSLSFLESFSSPEFKDINIDPHCALSKFLAFFFQQQITNILLALSTRIKQGIK